MTEIVLPCKGRGRDEELRTFARSLEEFSRQFGSLFTKGLSARGWGYQLEVRRLINKDQIDLVENLVNQCRDSGILPIDFTAEEEGRQFSGIERPDTRSSGEYIRSFLSCIVQAGEIYTPNWWKGEKYYIQMVVEKIDIKNLFEPICSEYHIPIATAKGWSSKLMRANYLRRFKRAEEDRLVCVLLYFGDHDPDGLRISDALMDNLVQLVNIRWKDGETGYDPSNLIIDRFGLSYETIMEYNLTWIDNLITGSGGYIAKLVNDQIVQGRTANGRPHPNFNLQYAQDYLKKFGVRKCEANAIIPHPEIAISICRSAIEKYLGTDSLERFARKRQQIVEMFDEFQSRTGLDEAIRNALTIIRDEEETEE